MDFAQPGVTFSRIWRMENQIQLLDPLVASVLARHGMSFEVLECNPELADTAAFLEHYGFGAHETCNAILGVAKSEPPKYGCCVVLANCKVDVNKKLCELLEVKRCSFASGEQTLALTGMQIGGVTPVGLPEDIPIFIDSKIMELPRVVLGGGNRNSKLIINPSELLKMPAVRAVEGLGLPR